MQARLVRAFVLPSTLLPLALLGLVAGCGGGEAETAELRGQFRLLRGDGSVECGTQDAVRRVEISLLDESGVSRRPGYPKELSCADGQFSLPAVAHGRYLVELVVFGQVGTSETEPMFRAQRVIEFPADNDLVVELEPEVAFFELGWTFGPRGDLTLCELEVDRVDVFVSSGTSQGAAYSGTFDCAMTPRQLPGALAPRTYTVRLDAKSEEGFTVYSVTQTRLLSKGENHFDAVLEALGGQLRVDWQFSIANAAPIQSCDDGEVGASTVDIRIFGLTGGDEVEESVACESLRPHAITAARFTRGRELIARLTSEGVHRFVGLQSFIMPDGDHDLPLVTLQAVGEVTLRFNATSSSTCAPERVDRYLVELRAPEGELLFEAGAAPEANAIEFSDVPYGVYEVRLMGFLGEQELCRVQSSRTVEGRENEWTDFSL